MAAPVFTNAEYADPPCTGLETREADGTWLGCTAYTHAARGNVVLWYGGETYEGFGEGYRWCADGGASGGPDGGAIPVLLDGDSDVVPTRWAHRRERAQGQRQGGAGYAPVPDPAAEVAAPPLAQRFLPFGEALAVARSLGLAGMSGAKEWRVWCKAGGCPPNVPRYPDTAYKDAGWQGWGHWLGAGNQAGGQQVAHFLPFEEALALAQSLGLANRFEWQQWSKEGLRPRNVPSMPSSVYKDHGWQGWGHWLGTGNTKSGTEQFLPFGEALAVTRSLGLVSWKEWQQWSKEGMRPRNVPSNPNKVYKDHGWQGWGHGLGTGSQRPRATKFLEFGEALRVARSLRLNNQKEWRAWCRSGARPANVPAAPDKFYVHTGWLGWEQWLCHAPLPPAPAPATAPTARKRAAQGQTNTPGKSRSKRQRR